MISVGPPYFDAVFVPLMLPVLALIALGPYVSWKSGDGRKVWLQLRGAAALSMLLAGGLALSMQSSVGVAVGLLLSIWIIVGSLRHVLIQLQAPAAGGIRPSWMQRGRMIPLSFWGMVIAHVGVGIFVAGVTLVKGLDHAQDASLKVGQSLALGAYRFEFKSLEKHAGPNYIAGRATFDVTQDGQWMATLHPEKRFYQVQGMPMSEAAIDRGFTRDLYVSLGDASPDEAWSVRVQVKPFMNWVWAGALVMVFGGGLAAADKRYRQRTSQPVAGVTSTSTWGPQGATAVMKGIHP